MKRIGLCLLIAAFCAFTLCGCGAGDERLDEMVVGTPMIPETSPLTTPVVTPMPTPDAADGIVNDGDGLIEDSDTGRGTTPEATKKPELAPGAANGKTSVSPNPQTTAQP